jgi:hypothetical protein
MGHQFVKTVRVKNKLYLYLAEEFCVNGKTIQQMIRRITEEEAEELGWRGTLKGSRVYSPLSTVLQIPLSEHERAHQETLLIRVWLEVRHPMTVISPQAVTFEPTGQVPAARFKLSVPPAALRPTVFVAVDSTCERSTSSRPVQIEDAKRNKVKSETIVPNPEKSDNPVRTQMV